MRTWTLKGVLARALVLSTKIIIPKTSAQKSFDPGIVQIYHSLICLTWELHSEFSSPVFEQLSATQPCWAWRAVPYSLGAAVLAITAHGDRDMVTGRILPGSAMAVGKKIATPNRLVHLCSHFQSSRISDHKDGG